MNKSCIGTCIGPIGVRVFSRWDGKASGLTDVHPHLGYDPLSRAFWPGTLDSVRFGGGVAALSDVLGTSSEYCKRRGHVIVTATRVIVMEDKHF